MGAIKVSTPTSTISEKSQTRRLVSHVVKFILVLCAFLLYLLVVPCVLVLLSPFFLYRFFVILLAKLFRHDIVEIVSVRDGVVGLDDATKENLCMITILIVLQGDPDIDLIREKFKEKVMEAKNPEGVFSYGKLKCYYESWLGFSFWKQEKDFKLEDHVRLWEPPEIPGQNNNNNEDPSDKSTSEEDFIQLMGPLTTRTFAPKISPWEILVIPNYVPAPGNLHSDCNLTAVTDQDKVKVVKSGPKFALIIRVHHAIGDGYSLMKLIVHNWCDVPLNKIPVAPTAKTSLSSKMFMYTRILFLSPYYQLRQFVFDVDRNLWHLRGSQLTREWQITMSERISVKEMRAIAVGHNVSTTAVLLAGFGGGIRNFLKESGQENKIPEVMRALGPMPWKGHPMDTLVNHWTLGTMGIPVGLDCPHKRLRAAEKCMRALKGSPILVTNFGAVPIFMGGPSWLTDIFGKNWMTTMNLSNFPGPNFMIKLFGLYPGEDCAFWLPQMRGTPSMGVAFMSYNGGIRISTTIDKAIIPDPTSAARLSSLINQEFKGLHSLTSYTKEAV